MEFAIINTSFITGDGEHWMLWLAVWWWLEDCEVGNIGGMFVDPSEQDVAALRIVLEAAWFAIGILFSKHDEARGSWFK